MATVSSLQALSSSSCIWICVGGSRRFSLVSSFFMNSSQSKSWKFLGKPFGALASAKSSVVSIRRWSVLIPGLSGRALQVIMASSKSLEMNTWSNLVHHLVMLCRCVMIPKYGQTFFFFSLVPYSSFPLFLFRTIILWLMFIGSDCTTMTHPRIPILGPEGCTMTHGPTLWLMLVCSHLL